MLLKLFFQLDNIIHVVVGSEYPTSNLFLPELYNIKRLLDRNYLAENGFMHSMVMKMKDKFDKY